MSTLPFNITNPGIWIDGVLTSQERNFVTDLVLASATASENEVLTWKSGAPSWEPATGGGGGLADGDYGDIVVSGGSTVLTIDTNAVTTGKIANQAVTRSKLEHIQSQHFLGRHAALTGDVQEVSPVQARTMLGLSTVATSGDYNDLSNRPDLSVFDEVEQHANLAAFPVTGNVNKFYLAQDTGIMYRWNGTSYVIISSTNLGDVVGPSSATNNAIARFDTTTGKLIKNSSVTVSDTGDLTASSFVGSSFSSPESGFEISLDGVPFAFTFGQDITGTGSYVNRLGVTASKTTVAPKIQAIGSDTNIGINIAPKGTGDVILGTMRFDSDQSIGAGQDNFVLTYDHASGKISLEAATGGGGGITEAQARAIARRYALALG